MRSEIPAGTSLAGRLNAALEASQSGVIVWSTSYSDSEWCLKEYNTMESMAADKKRGFHFVVAKLRGAKLPPLVREEVYVDFTDYPDGPRGGELIKLMHGALGAPISKEVLLAAQALDDETKELLIRLHAARDIENVAALRQMVQKGGAAWLASPLLYSTAAEALIELGRYDEALEVLSHPLRLFRSAIRPIQLQALALARKGRQAAVRASEEKATTEERAAARAQAEELLMNAQQQLAELERREHRDPETLGIYARTWMDRYDLTGNPLHLEKSRDIYARAFELNDTDHYTGVNAAAKSVLLGDLKRAGELAKRVEELVGDEAIAGDYWKTATVAEVQLLQRNFDRAASLYRKAVVDSPHAVGSHGSTRLQAERLLSHLNPPEAARAAILASFSLGPVAVASP
jgi:tetratricopeptide (TPR) repeat protein